MEFHNEADKVCFTASYFRGTVATYFKQYIKQYESGVATPEITRIFKDYNEFQQSLESNFSTLDEKKEVERNIRKLQQLGSASDYITKYR